MCDVTSWGYNHYTIRHTCIEFLNDTIHRGLTFKSTYLNAYRDINADQIYSLNNCFLKLLRPSLYEIDCRLYTKTILAAELKEFRDERFEREKITCIFKSCEWDCHLNDVC